MSRQGKELADFEAAVKACWSEVPHFTRSSDPDTTYEYPKLNTAWWAFAAGIDYAERNGTIPSGSVAVPQAVIHQTSNTLAGYLK